jgi:hypothetical protein
LLSREQFDTLPEVQVMIERKRWEYKEVRPLSCISYRLPAAEAFVMFEEIASRVKIPSQLQFDFCRLN